MDSKLDISILNIKVPKLFTSSPTPIEGIFILKAKDIYQNYKHELYFKEKLDAFFNDLTRQITYENDENIKIKRLNKEAIISYLALYAGQIDNIDRKYQLDQKLVEFINQYSPPLDINFNKDWVFESANNIRDNVIKIIFEAKLYQSFATIIKNYPVDLTFTNTTETFSLGQYFKCMKKIYDKQPIEKKDALIHKNIEIINELYEVLAENYTSSDIIFSNYQKKKQLEIRNKELENLLNEIKQIEKDF